MSARNLEYQILLSDILNEDAALRAQGLPGLSLSEVRDLRAIVIRAQRKMAANAKEQK